MWQHGLVKITIEVSDEILRRARIVAKSCNLTLRSLFAEALEVGLRQLPPPSGDPGRAEPPWMAGFGQLADLADENRRVLAAIEAEFETLDPEHGG